MATFLVILHGLLAVALLGSITHQAIAVVLPARRKAGFFNAYRAVSSRVYVNANVILFLAVALLGGVIYPTYRVWVRTYLENARLYSAVGSFEVKEQFISIGLGLLPLYWLVWRRPEPAGDSARVAVTLMLCFIVWFGFLVGHILNNIRGFGLLAIPGLLERGNPLPLRQRGEPIGYAGVPKEIAGSAVVDQIAIIREVDRHVGVDARRPQRLVLGMRKAAIDDIEALHLSRTCGGRRE